MVQFEENSIYIVDDVELLEHIISQTVSDVQHDTNNPLFNQLEGQFYVTQRTYDEFDKVLPTVDYGNLSFCFEIVDKFENLLSWFGIKNAKLIPKKNNLNAPRDIKKKVLEYFESGEFVIPETSDYTSLNVGRQHDHGDLGIINCIVNEDFLGKSQSFENKGLTINPNINVYSKNNTELEYLHGISAPGLAPNRMNAKFHESKQFPGYSSN